MSTGATTEHAEEMSASRRCTVVKVEQGRECKRNKGMIWNFLHEWSGECKKDFFYRAGSVKLCVCVCCVCVTDRKVCMNASLCRRALGKSFFVRHELLMLRSAGSYVIDSNTNLKHALTLIRCLNASADDNKLYSVLDTEHSGFLRVTCCVAAGWMEYFQT